MKKEQIMESLLKKFQEATQKRHNETQQHYVVALKRVKDESLIGYHLSTVGQITQDILSAKRYDVSGDVGGQLRIIQNNYDYKFDPRAVSEEAIFGDFNKKLLEKYFKGMTKEDFYLEPVELEVGTPKQTFTFTKIN